MTANILLFLPLLILPPFFFFRFDLRDPGGGDRAVHKRVPPADEAQRQHGRLHRHRARHRIRIRVQDQGRQRGGRVKAIASFGTGKTIDTRIRKIQ